MEELNGAIRLLRCASTGRMIKQGVSMTHLHVMWRLEEYGTLPMNRLADMLDVSFSNATGLVDRMEERGLVERVRDVEDRRVVLVRLTPAARVILEEVAVMKRDLTLAVLERLDARQLDRLYLALKDFRQAIRDEADQYPERFGGSDGHDHPVGHDHGQAHGSHTHTNATAPATAGRELTTR